MPRTLLLFLHSSNPGVYINVLCHCTKSQDVNSVFFAVKRDVTGHNTGYQELIEAIRREIDSLTKAYPDTYNRITIVFPATEKVREHLIFVNYIRPQEVVNELKKRFQTFDELIVDVTACSKPLACDVMTAFMVNGIKHVCTFELADHVQSKEWKGAGKTFNFHDLTSGEVAYYEYHDFSAPGATSESLEKMRKQGRLIKVFLGIAIAFGVVAFVSISIQQSFLAGLATLAAAFISGISLFSDVWGIRDKFRAK